jgi:thioesterase III
MTTEFTLKVRGYHADMFGHVNHARYLEFLEEGRWDYFDKKKMFALFHQHQIGHVVANINIDYRKSASPGDILRVKTFLKETGNKRVVFQQDILQENKETIVISALITNVYFNLSSNQTLPVDPDLIQIWPELTSIGAK